MDKLLATKAKRARTPAVAPAAAPDSISIADAASLFGLTARAIRKACAEGRYAGAFRVLCGGAEQWRIPIAALTAEQMGKILSGRADSEDRAVSPSGDAAFDGIWALWDQATEKDRLAAQQRFDAVSLFESEAKSGQSAADAIAAMNESLGTSHSRASVYRWAAEVKSWPRREWLPRLLPNKAGRTARDRAQLSEEARDFIYREYFCTSKPPLKSVYRRVLREAHANAWVVPSYGAIKNLIEAEPEWFKVLHRDGEDAFRSLFPSMRRDYLSLELHQMWCADGRRADVFCRFDDGSIGRPWVSAWIDMRSRVIVGFRVGKLLNQELTRLSFHAAATSANAIPRQVYLDNGREYGAKAITGGVQTRNRFKFKEDEELGVLPRLGIEIIWATPYNGRAKPIESFWNTISKNVDRRAEFVGAYCGNRPDAKPEDFDRARAVPVARYTQALSDELDAYHSRSHRGHGMSGRSPREIYEELIASTIVQKPTSQQLSMCLLRRVGVTVDRESRISIGTGAARTYYTHPKLLEVPRGADLVVWYDPEKLAQPLRVEWNKRFLCDASPQQRVPFRNEAAIRDHQRAVGEERRAKKALANAKLKQRRSSAWIHAPTDQGAAISTEKAPPASTIALPAPANPQILHAPMPPKPHSIGTAAEAASRTEQINKAIREQSEANTNKGTKESSKGVWKLRVA